MSPSIYTMSSTLEWGGEMAGTVFEDFRASDGPGLVDITLGDNYARSGTNGGEGRQIIAASTAQISGTASPAAGSSWISGAVVNSRIDYWWRVEPSNASACALIPECSGITQVPVVATFQGAAYAQTSSTSSEPAFSVNASVWAFVGSQAFLGSDKLLGVENAEILAGNGFVVNRLLPPPDGPGFVDTVVALGVEQDLTISTEIFLNGPALASAIETVDFFGKATAVIDPIIQVDPNFAYADYFDVHVSENIAINDPDFPSFAIPDTVVPVPASVWLFGSGLIGLIGIARRKMGSDHRFL